MRSTSSGGALVPSKPTHRSWPHARRSSAGVTAAIIRARAPPPARSESIARMLRLAPALGLALLVAPAALADDAGAVNPAFVRGTELFVRRKDGTLVTGKKLVGAIIVGLGPDGKLERFKILDVEPDRGDPAGEIQLYTFHMQDPATGAWKDPCPPGPMGAAKAFPLEAPGDERARHVRSDHFSITCAHAPMGKCVRWGYKYWKKAADGTSLWDHHQACYRMTR